MKASIDQCHHNLVIANAIIAHLNDSHLAYHVGQLYGWCAAAGIGPVSKG